MCLSVVAQNFSTVPTPTDGYRGFGGLNVFTGIGNHPYDRFAVTSVHGFQTDHLYIGIGASMQFSTNNYDYDYNNNYDDDDEIEFVMPFFINMNYEMPVNRIAPFADLKIGYSVGDANGLYLLPSVGIRLSHISVWCGYNLLQDKKVDTRNNNKTDISYYNSIAFGVTLDWGARNKN